MFISIIFIVAVIRNEANIQIYVYEIKDCTAYCGLLYSQ